MRRVRKQPPKHPLGGPFCLKSGPPSLCRDKTLLLLHPPWDGYVGWAAKLHGCPQNAAQAPFCVATVWIVRKLCLFTGRFADLGEVDIAERGKLLIGLRKRRCRSGAAWV